MSKVKIMTSLNKVFNKTSLKVKKHSPEILVVGGIIGAVTSAVMACKATTKLSGIIDESKEQIEQIHDYVDENGFSEKYTENDSKKDLAIVYTQTGVKLAKLYAPAIILGVLSITSILASNNILRKRNAALAAAYAVVDKGFKEYRSRVIERFGEKVDKELKYNIKAKEIDVTTVDENGNEKTEKQLVDVVDDPNEFSPYARIYDDGNIGWSKDSELNLMFLNKQQNYANDLLQKRGYLFLNEVYDMLGFPKTKAGQIVGWVYDEAKPIGDNFVDFGFYDIHRKKARDFVNGYEKSVILDFNVDGNILDLI